MEIWKDIPNYEGLYQISNKGTIKNYKGRVLNPRIGSTGYSVIELYKNGKRKKPVIHRIMAILFIQNPEDKPQVNHKNGTRTDYSLENLEWCTESENIKHSYDVLGRNGKHHPNMFDVGSTMRNKYGSDNHISKQTELTNILSGETMIFQSQTEAANFLGVKQNAVCRAIQRNGTLKSTFKAKLIKSLT